MIELGNIVCRSKSNLCGGLRTNDCFKINKVDAPLISIVTVVLNDEAGLRKTIASVTSQCYINFEFIVVDGGSNDDTIRIIRDYESCIDFWISEEDTGIYDAMNKGNSLACGEYLLFLNAGDTFVDNNVINDVVKSADRFDRSLIVGRTRVLYKGRDLGVVSPAIGVELDVNSEAFPHQAAFINKNIYKNMSYDLAFRISADKEYWNRVRKVKNFSVIFVNIDVSNFELGGVSNNRQNIIARRIENLFIENRYKKVNLSHFSKIYLLILISYIFQSNDKIYYRCIYPFFSRLRTIKSRLID